MSGPFAFEAFEHEGLHSYLHSAYEDRTEDQVYLDLIWQLTDGLKRFAIPRYHRDAGVAACGEPYALVDWEYEVEIEQDCPPSRESIRGFVPARSAVSRTIRPPGLIFDPPSPYDAENEAKAGLFEVWRPERLADVVRSLQCDVSAELNVFALAGSPIRLASALTQAQPPALGEALGPGGIFVDLVIGVDMGYSSVLLIQSDTDLSEKLAAYVVA
jgi:hypothetical protein